MDFESFHRVLKKEKVYSCLINIDSRKLYEFYKNNKQKEKLHKINSCTKSVMSILVGIALDKGFLTSIDLPLSDFLPEILKGQTDSRKNDIQIRHLLTMTDGLDFPEFGEWNCFAPMVYYHDIVKFVLERPLIHQPGVHMNYNSGCSHILSAILQQVTDMKTEEFASKHLFGPLGIKDYRWYLDKMNINKGADGLVLKISDMEKIGLLMLQQGLYAGKRIVSEEWVQLSTAPNLETYPYIGHYGLHWWVSRLDEREGFIAENRFFFALGFGGQFILIYPYYRLVATITSEIYDDSLRPLRLLRKHLFPQLAEKV